MPPASGPGRPGTDATGRKLSVMQFADGSSPRVGIALDMGLRSLDPAAVYARPERVGSLVRDAAIQAGLGQTDSAAPWADVVRPGASGLVKPNWGMIRNGSGQVMEGGGV